MIFLLVLLSWIQSHSDSAVKCVFNVLLAKLSSSGSLASYLSEFMLHSGVVARGHRTSLHSSLHQVSPGNETLGLSGTTCGKVNE